MPEAIDLWSNFQAAMDPLFGEDDDPALWFAVTNVVFLDAQALCGIAVDGRRIVAQLGRCSHWLRPHQTRWPADGGFAWPTGYDGEGFSRLGLPEFDWFRQWCWNSDSHRWEVWESAPSSSELVFRVAIPGRSRRHLQAAVHTIWQPGTPPRPGRDFLQFYGFRQQATGAWKCTAYRPCPWRSESFYERAAEQAAADVQGRTNG